jgi:hypothetical protein
MQQEFLNMSPETWNVMFLVIRYVVVALILAYLANVYVKRKNIHTDINGRLLEWRVDAYKIIHRWVMKFQSVIAAPSQYEEHYRNILAPTRFQIGYQGMEYASFFDSPDRLFQFGMEFDQMMNKEENIIDSSLKHHLTSFQYWLDDVITFYGTFVQVEYDKRWKFDEKTVKKHCELACKVLGIALQKDVNKYYREVDEMLRDRLRNLKISGIYTETRRVRMIRKATLNCEAIMDKEEETWYSHIVEWFYYHFLHRSYGCSQLLKNQNGMMAIFMQVHFEEQFAKNPAILEDRKEVGRLTTEFYDCYTQYLNR